MALSKSAARKIGRDYRSSLSEAEYEELSRKVTGLVLEELVESGFSAIHVYDSITDNREVSTHKLISNLKNRDASVHIQSRLPDFPGEEFDVVILPALAIDNSGNRVGYGQGGYDRFLSAQPVARFIALCFDGQLVDEIEHESLDMPVDMVITESQVKRFN